MKGVNSNNKLWDVIVIGGGPAGMMAAGRATELGKSVLLLEKNDSLGQKLLITGGGRCNVTNYKPDMKHLVASYRGRPKALFSIFSQFGVEDTLNFFHSRNMATKVEAEDRVFPITDKAESVWKVLVNYLKQNHVSVQSNSAVIGLKVDKVNNYILVETKDTTLMAKSCVVATGGTSRPETGSTGDGYKWLKKLGHTIIANNFALVPLALKDSWSKQLSGVTLKDIKLSIVQDGKKVESRHGKLLFTHLGISGPTVLNMSSKVGELLQYGEVIIEVDLLPEVQLDQLRLKLNTLLAEESNKKIKNTLSKFILPALTLPLLKLANIDPGKFNHSVTREERQRLIQLLKAIPLNVKKLLGADKAIVSAGGVDINEVDFKTMRSKIVENIFIVGDVLNIDRPSGGYSLQICWASGYVAGVNC